MTDQQDLDQSHLCIGCDQWCDCDGWDEGDGLCTRCSDCMDEWPDEDFFDVDDDQEFEAKADWASLIRLEC